MIWLGLGILAGFTLGVLLMAILFVGTGGHHEA